MSVASVVSECLTVAERTLAVNPMAVRNKDVDVFTANKRDVLLLSVPSLQESQDPVPIPIVAVSAMLVGSNTFTETQGAIVQKGDEVRTCNSGSQPKADPKAATAGLFRLR